MGLGALGGHEYLRAVASLAAGVDGGTFTQDVWQTRALTLIPDNDIPGASLIGNTISLPAGTYYARGRGCGNQVAAHKLRIYDTTGAAALLVGETGQGAAVTEVVNNWIEVKGKFTLLVDSVIELQHFCITTQATDGFGLATDIDSTTEEWASLEIWVA